MAKLAHVPRLGGRGENLLHSVPSGSIILRCSAAREIGTCVNWWFRNPTTIFGLPVIPACTLEGLLAELKGRLERRGHAVIVVAESTGQGLIRFETFSCGIRASTLNFWQLKSKRTGLGCGL